MGPKKSTGSIIRALCLIGIALFLHSITLGGIFGCFPHIVPWWFLVCFVSGSVLCGCAFLYQHNKERYLFFYLGIMVSLLFPVAGIMGIAAIFAYKFFTRDKLYNEDDFEIALEKEDILKEKHVPDSDEESFVREQLDIQSFREILQGNNTELKRSVIEKLSQKDTCDDIQLLIRTLKDSDPEVRFYASAALKKIEENFEIRILAIKEKLKAAPYSTEHNLALGKEYLKLCRSGLIEKNTRLFYLHKAWSAIENTLGAINPLEVLLEAGKIKIELGEYEAGIAYLNQACDLDPTNWQVLIWRCEANFHLKNLDKIPSDCEVIKRIKPPWDSVQNITDYWLEHVNT